MNRRFRWRYAGGMIAWKPAWFWCGLTWQRSVDLGRTDRPVWFDLFICILPMLPICVKFRREKRNG